MVVWSLVQVEFFLLPMASKQVRRNKPGSTDEDKIIDLAALGVAGSHAALNFVSAGFPGAGE